LRENEQDGKRLNSNSIGFENTIDFLFEQDEIDQHIYKGISDLKFEVQNK
jgi:hypothetical protein